MVLIQFVQFLGDGVVPLGEEITRLHGIDVVGDGRLHLRADASERLREGRRPIGEPHCIVDDEYLAVAVVAGADADGRNRQFVGDPRREGGGNLFEDARESPAVLLSPAGVPVAGSGAGGAPRQESIRLSGRPPHPET